MSNEPAEPTPTGSEPPSEPTTPTTPEPKAAETPPPAEPEKKPESMIGGKDEPPAFDTAEVTIDGLKEFLPEGTELDETYAPQFVARLNEATSKADLAKSLMELQNEMTTAAANAQTEAWNTQIEEWQGAVKNDPTYGGEKLEASLAAARGVLEEYGGTRTVGDDGKVSVDQAQVKELKELFAVSGIGNHIGMVRLLNNLRAAIPGEAKPVQGNPAPTTLSRADALFGGKT